MPDQSPQNPTPEDFQDPLQNYEPKTYDDPVEQALAETTVDAIVHQPSETISPDTKISEAVQKLAGFHIACLLVEQEGKLVGVFSDRDVLDKVALEYDALKDRPVSEVMTTQPVFVYESDPAAAAISVMAVSGYRHVPILNVNDELIGIVSQQRVIDSINEIFETE